MSSIQSNENDSAFSLEELSGKSEQARQELSEFACRELEIRYNRKFSGDRMIFDPGIGRTKLIVHPEGEERLLFFVTITGETEFEESYVRALCEDVLQNTLAETLPGTEVNVVLLDDGAPETNAQLPLTDYIKQHDANRALVRIIAEKDTAPEISLVRAAVQGASQFYNLSVAVNFWILDHEGFDRCQQAFKSLPSVSEAMIRSFNPLNRFSIALKKGIVCSPEDN